MISSFSGPILDRRLFQNSNRTHLPLITLFVFLILITGTLCSHPGIPCRIDENLALAYLRNPEWISKARDTASESLDFNFSYNETVILELMPCDFDNLTANWDPQVYVKNLKLVQEILRLTGETNYDFLFQFVSKEDHTTLICDNPPSYTIKFLCETIPKIPSLAPLLHSTVYYDELNATALDALEHHPITQAWMHMNQYRESMENETTTTTTTGNDTSLSGVITEFLSPTKYPSTHDVYHNDPDVLETSSMTTLFTVPYAENVKKVNLRERLKTTLMTDDLGEYLRDYTKKDTFQNLDKVGHVPARIWQATVGFVSGTFRILNQNGGRVYRCWKASARYYDQLRIKYEKFLKKDSEVWAEFNKLPLSEQKKIVREHMDQYSWRKSISYQECMYGEEIHQKKQKEMMETRKGHTNSSSTAGILLGEDIHITYWTGYGEAIRDFYWVSLDFVEWSKCRICWFLKPLGVDCCNENDCNKGGIYSVDPIQPKCAFPLYKTYPIGYQLIRLAGIESLTPEELMCNEFNTVLSYGQAFVWFIASFTSRAWLDARPNWIPWLDWVYYSVHTSLPPNLIVCLLSKANHGINIFFSVFIGGFVISQFLIFVGIITCTLQKRQKKKLLVQIPTSIEGVWVKGHQWIGENASSLENLKNAVITEGVSEFANDVKHVVHLGAAFVSSITQSNSIRNEDEKMHTD